MVSLRTATRRAGVLCQVLPDGATVSVGDSAFEPDALGGSGAPLPPSAVIVPDPVIIVEVLSPSTRVVDLTLKVNAYFQIGSL